MPVATAVPAAADADRPRKIRPGARSLTVPSPVVLELTVVDAFTSEPFRGNPAAVAILPAFVEDSRMQAVAREMHLSETAFVVPREDGDHDLRWFTPAVEVELCGHATLAAAHVLGGFARFHTRSGVLPCRQAEDGWIEMDFPADRAQRSPAPPGLELPGLRWYGVGRWDSLVELEDATLVRKFDPDLRALAEVGTRAVIVTAAGDRPGVDCVSRVFAPNYGIPEDPVTGAAHCTLAVYWSNRLGRSALVGEQASPRGGTVRMRLEGERVALGGQAITVARTHLLPWD
jgi:predicted PhzF superfamily epimerase YddE/YHI9